MFFYPPHLRAKDSVPDRAAIWVRTEQILRLDYMWGSVWLTSVVLAVVLFPVVALAFSAPGYKAAGIPVG